VRLTSPKMERPIDSPTVPARMAGTLIKATISRLAKRSLLFFSSMDQRLAYAQRLEVRNAPGDCQTVHRLAEHRQHIRIENSRPPSRVLPK
jgi:hypothetical protein